MAQIYFYIYLLLTYISDVYSVCNVPPKFWCNTKQIAKDCMVLPQCSEWNWVEEDAPPVVISVYMESLCPDTIHFISRVLFPTWQKLFPTGIIKTEIIPFGKATVTRMADGSTQYKCQHGPAECRGNLIENCIIRQMDYKEEYYLPIINCMATRNPPEVFEKCVTSHNADWTGVERCANGMDGQSLMSVSAAKTFQLKPELTFVPWILINGVHTHETQHEALNNLGWLICETYRGKQPEECNEYLQNKY